LVCFDGNIIPVKPKLKLHKPTLKLNLKLLTISFNTAVVVSSVITISALVNSQTQAIDKFTSLANEHQNTLQELQSTSSQLETVKKEDQRIINQNLQKETDDIQNTYKSSVASYENLLKLKEKTTENLDSLDKLYTESIILLSDRKLSEASVKFSELNSQIENKETKLAQEAAKAAAEIAVKEAPSANNTPPGSGYSRQYVNSEAGTFLVSMIAADLASSRVIVDTASASSCPNNCPVLSLAEYVSRNNAFAGINGSYFCPSTYPSCAGKENSFDTLLMNKDKTYFNSDNNVYSTVPAVIFGSGWIRFVSRSQEWGRDTSIDSMIANQGLLMLGGNVTYEPDGDPKKGSKGGRSFVANRGNSVYIGVVHNATVAESARVMKALGMENALNLDSGGSTALWNGGYKVGPGRSLPNAILFIKK